MVGMKVFLTLRYRPLSDTVVAFVEDDLNGVGAPETDLHSAIQREKLDADTTVEWVKVGDQDILVGAQQIHASVRPYVDGMPAIIASLVTDLVLIARDSPVDKTLSPALEMYEFRRKIDMTLLHRPIAVVAKRQASKATTKGVEAALHHVMDNLQASIPSAELSEPIYAALRDLTNSIKDGDGLSSERSVDSVFNIISQSSIPSRRKKLELLAFVNDLRDQRTWQRAIDKAASDSELVTKSERELSEDD